MRYTNKFGLPEAIVRAVTNDEYDRGDSVMSVTQLISPPRIVLLQRVNEDKLEVDVADRIPSVLGTAVHKLVEKGAAGLSNYIVEERLFLEVRGWKISGAVDLQIDNGDGTWAINDYKITGTYSVMTEKPEWERQLNCYAYLSYKSKERRVTSLKIIAILRDWQRKQAEINPNYPQCQVVTVDIPVWSYEQQRDYVESRVKMHQDAEKAVDSGEPLSYCSDEERWVRGETWALMKEGRKSAVKLYDNKEDAESAVIKGHYVEHRPGNAIRCSGNYCMVSAYCKQWQEELGSRSGEGSG